MATLATRKYCCGVRVMRLRRRTRAPFWQRRGSAARPADARAGRADDRGLPRVLEPVARDRERRLLARRGGQAGAPSASSPSRRSAHCRVAAVAHVEHQRRRSGTRQRQRLGPRPPRRCRRGLPEAGAIASPSAPTSASSNSRRVPGSAARASASVIAGEPPVAPERREVGLGSARAARAARRAGSPARRGRARARPPADGRRSAGCRRRARAARRRSTPSPRSRRRDGARRDQPAACRVGGTFGSSGAAASTTQIAPGSR